MKSDIELNNITRELIDFLSTKDITVSEAKIIIERLPDMIDIETKLKLIA